VAARDGWICRLCEEPIDLALNWPDPGSASLDHVIPVSRGGSGELANLRLAHLHCNTSRGNGEPRVRPGSRAPSTAAAARHAAIAERLGRGQFHKRIAEEVGVSERTVERVAASLREMSGSVV